MGVLSPSSGVGEFVPGEKNWFDCDDDGIGRLNPKRQKRIKTDARIHVQEKPQQRVDSSRNSALTAADLDSRCTSVPEIPSGGGGGASLVESHRAEKVDSVKLKS